MEIRDKELFEILLEFNSYLASRIRIIAVGGTALTLLGKKASTKDVDFCFEDEKEQNRFIQSAKRLGYSVDPPNRLIRKDIAIDIYSGGYIFAVQLPADYKEKATLIKEMEKIALFALSPLDLIVTKAARFNQRDDEDLRSILLNYPLDQNELVERYIQTMENSMVRDAKDNLIALFALMEKISSVNKTALEKAERWARG